MTRYSLKIMILMAAATVLLTACTDEQTAEQQRMPITLTASITPTRAIANPTQETQLVEGQDVYVWANEETSGSVDWTQKAYIRAWNLTTGSSGALSSSNSYYYPSGSLSMVAIHGNFSFTEGTDAFPGIVTHTVSTDQSTLANYAASDLLYWKQSGVTGSSSALPVTFGHKLSKIEIHLSSSEYTTAQLNDMEVTLNNVLPSADIDLTNGSISEAHGTEITIRPYKTNYVDYEAIIPPQTRPHDFIKVTYKGTVVNVEAQVTGFDANNRYVYDFDMINKDIRKNPLWYVAEYNVNYDGANYSWATSDDEGAWFVWNDAMKAFTTSSNLDVTTPIQKNVYYTGSGVFGGWHLPIRYEWNSIIPSRDDNAVKVSVLGDGLSGDAPHNPDAMISSDGAGLIYTNPTTLCFGYNDQTAGTDGIFMKENSYFYRKSSTLYYAIRYCDSEYCSAWKYEGGENTITISCTLLGRSYSAAEAQAEFGTDDSKWAAIYFGNNESLGAVQRKFYYCGYYRNTGEFKTGYCYYWSASALSATNAYACTMGSNYTSHHHDNKNGRYQIRLFRNNDSFMDLEKNPLWYVAKTNVDYDGTSTYSFASSPSTPGYYFKWNDAMKVFSTTSNETAATPATVTSYYTRSSVNNKPLFGYHLPIIYEWNSIAPYVIVEYMSAYTATRIYMWDYFSVGNGKTFDKTAYICLGYNNTTKGTGGTFMTEKSYWYRPSSTVLYAIRYCDSEFCSAWKYEQHATAGVKSLTISCTLLPNRLSTSQAESLYGTTASNWESIYFGNNSSKGAMQMVFYPTGELYPSDSSPINTDDASSLWSTTISSGTHAWAFSWGDTEGGSGFESTCWSIEGGYAMPVRLFRDN